METFLRKSENFLFDISLQKKLYFCTLFATLNGTRNIKMQRTSTAR
jgi:hypothetical protein